MKVTFAEDFEKKLKLCKKLKKSFKSRKSTNYQEIIFGDKSKVVFNSDNKFKSGIFLFSMVRSDINKYIQKNGYVTPYDEFPVNYINTQYNKGNLIGVDINNAYWSVAYLKDYISEKTFLKGLEKKEYKSIRLSALSTLGAKKVYRIYEKGEYVKDELHSPNKEIRKFYDDIRFSTFAIMYELSLQLNNDFESWKTDCINFYNTPENIKLVTDHITDYGLQCKIEEK